MEIILREKALSKTRDKSYLIIRVLKQDIDISLKMPTGGDGMEQIERKIQKGVEVSPWILKFPIEEKFDFSVRIQSILFIIFKYENVF